MDTVFLSRVQFALTVAFHYVFPPLSIGLGLILVIMEAMWLRTGKTLYREMTKFWVKIFALIFSIGVASGIVMEFQFGTNWAAYSRYVGDVFGSALAAEGIFAFFLESGFLALLIFGWDKVGKFTHFFATLMVALGSTFSAIWIVVANSWMQTPAGYEILTDKGILRPVNGVLNLGNAVPIRAQVHDFWHVVFNPSTLDRLWHTVMGAWQAAAWLVISVSAYYLLKRRHTEFAKASLRAAFCVALGASLLQLVSGHDSAMGVAQNQAAKMAAFEGHWKTRPAGLYLFGWYTPPAPEVTNAEGTVQGVAIPGMLSWLIHGDTGKPVDGLEKFAPNIPPVNAVFQTYHAMVGIGMALILLSVLGVIFWWRRTLWQKRWFLRICVLAVLLPQAANQLGWFSAEVGRQPWIVYGMMKTQAAVSPGLTPAQVWGSLIMFGIMYLMLLVLFLYLLDHKIRQGPEAVPEAAPLAPPGHDRADA
jgi:cytochrome d ubiquinol oxidase subunit I